MTKITERGMIFNGEIVRALLSGRKTQTRRIIKPQPEVTLSGSLSGKWLSRPLNGLLLPKIEDIAIHCPFGAVGDRIWVRETWGVVSHAFSDDGLMIDWVPDRPATAIHEMPFGNGYYSGYAIYAADGDFTWGDDDGYEDGRWCWKPSIHMPRAASRILLEITDVRVERLRSMSQDDARAEGVIAASGPMEAGLAFRELWNSIYGEESWKANPWVWVIEFKRVEGGAA
ncbi:hypothetical protein ACXDJK_000306 [Klebsiella pneumoniae]|uniref:hypothetical protein n=1 Tax=Klebsiella TaxID=570 RepID=UPI001141CBA5|nr:hypothetical protein [Klebsiella pneumoniae]TYW66690.1 hypothetical protein FCG65_012995 [Klebsiella pneumoniae]HBQ8001871.1 hypothetical protein [Klebsiella pneumoniae]HEK5353938.1 hypothetical protein [Klebsiella pneumoniae]HEK8426620.1 hypothetical protein [Klebsiella pneumoniae]